MTTIGKNAAEVEMPVVPRGIVNQRRALFASEPAISLSTFSTPVELPSTSVVQNRRGSFDDDVLYSDQQRRSVQIQVTQMRAPADLVRRSPDDDVSDLQRRVVLVRHPVNQDPKITVNEVRSNESKHKTINRVFPIVTVNVGEQEPFSSHAPMPSITLSPPRPVSTDWQARPPSVSLFRQPGTGPVHSNIMSTSTKSSISKAIHSVEGEDTVTFDRKPGRLPDYHRVAFETPEYSTNGRIAPPPVKMTRKNIGKPLSMDIRALEKQTAIKIDDLYRRGDNVDQEIVDKETELAKAKEAIQKLSKDLQRLGNDCMSIGDGSIIEEEDIDIDFGGRHDEKKKEREEKVRIDATEILRECNRMMVRLREEEEADAKLLEKIQRGEASEEEVQREILRLQRQVAELNAMGVELPPFRAKQNSTRSQEDTSQIVSLKNQAVMFSTGSNSRQEALISRLERELTDAQTCNHRLNAQLGNMANNNESTLKREFLGLQVCLLLF